MIRDGETTTDTAVRALAEEFHTNHWCHTSRAPTCEYCWDAALVAYKVMAGIIASETLTETARDLFCRPDTGDPLPGNVMLHCRAAELKVHGQPDPREVDGSARHMRDLMLQNLDAPVDEASARVLNYALRVKEDR